MSHQPPLSPSPSLATLSPPSPAPSDAAPCRPPPTPLSPAAKPPRERAPSEDPAQKRTSVAETMPPVEREGAVLLRGGIAAVYSWNASPVAPDCHDSPYTNQPTVHQSNAASPAFPAPPHFPPPHPSPFRPPFDSRLHQPSPYPPSHSPPHPAAVPEPVPYTHPMRHHTEHAYSGPPAGYGEINPALHALSGTSSAPPRQRKPRPKREKKPKPDHTPRPPNAWILYRSDKLVDMRTEEGDERRPQANLSKLIAELWKQEPSDVKRKYEQLADLRKVQHQQQYPDYRFQPKKKEPKVPKRTGAASAGSSPQKESGVIRFLKGAHFAAAEEPSLSVMSRAASEAAASSSSFSSSPLPDFASPLPPDTPTVGDPIISYSTPSDTLAPLVERPTPIRAYNAPAAPSPASSLDRPPPPPQPFLPDPLLATGTPSVTSGTAFEGYSTPAADEFNFDFGSPEDLAAPDTPSRLAASWAEIGTPEATPAEYLVDPQEVLAAWPSLFEPPPPEWLQSGLASAPASLTLNTAPFFDPGADASGSSSSGVPSPSPGSASPDAVLSDAARPSTSGTWTADELSAHPAFLSLTLPASELETAVFDYHEASSSVYSASTSPYTPFTPYTPFSADNLTAASFDSPMFDELARWARDDAAAQQAQSASAAAEPASFPSGKQVAPDSPFKEGSVRLDERSSAPDVRGLGLYLERPFSQEPPQTATQAVADPPDDFGMAAYRQRASQDSAHS